MLIFYLNTFKDSESK